MAARPGCRRLPVAAMSRERYRPFSLFPFLPQPHRPHVLVRGTIGIRKAVYRTKDLFSPPHFRHLFTSLL